MFVYELHHQVTKVFGDITASTKVKAQEILSVETNDVSKQMECQGRKTK